MEKRVTVRVPDEDQKKIEKRIKREYPVLKTVSDVVRKALEEFLEDEPEKAVSAA